MNIFYQSDLIIAIYDYFVAINYFRKLSYNLHMYIHIYYFKGLRKVEIYYNVMEPVKA